MYSTVYSTAPFLAWSSFISSTTASAVATSLAPDCLDTWSTTQAAPLVLAMDSGSSASRTTLATSDSRTAPPVWRGMITLATSSTVWSLASVVTVRVWEPFRMSPPGKSRFSAVRIWAM